MLTPCTRPFARTLALPILLAALLAACGDDAPEPEPPAVSELAISCEDSAQAGQQVVTSVGARVSDPDRDLVSVTGTVNGTPMSLSDDDGDDVYTWAPPEPMTCSGDFDVRITATDAEGNETRFDELVSK